MEANIQIETGKRHDGAIIKMLFTLQIQRKDKIVENGRSTYAYC